MGQVGILFLLLLLFPGVNLRSRDYYGNLPLFVRGAGFWVWCEGKHFSCMRYSICSRMYVFILHIFWEVRPSLGLTWQPSISKHNLCSSSVYVSKLSRTREEFNTWFGSDATAVLKVTSPTTTAWGRSRWATSADIIEVLFNAETTSVDTKYF